MNDNKLRMTDKISYEEYKQMVIQDDLAKFSKNLKPFWWENIPLIGALIYLCRIEIKISGLDRGLLPKEINVTYLIFSLSLLFCLDFLFRFLTPWYSYWVYLVALKRTKKKIAKNDI